MAKPKRERPSDNPIGQKINHVLREKGLTGDYLTLAKEFEVALTSVYGWVDKGRISKDRLPKLAHWSGYPLDWWLSSDSPLSSKIEPEASQSTEPELIEAFSDWRLQASPQSLQTINKLALLAQKNALRDEDWTLIDQLASRFKQKP